MSDTERTPGSARVASVGGVPVALHWSLPVMVALVASGLAQTRFSTEAPGHSTMTYIVAGALTAVGLILGVLVHEISHAVVARLRGLHVEGITLTWMGGMTQIRDENQTPATEFLVAFAGPAASALVGLVLWAIRAAVPSSAALALAALGWLAWINIALAVFNILPAAPLDGGRILHGLVWKIGRDRWTATRVSAGAGILIGLAIVVLGFVSVGRRGDIFDALIFAFIGWWMIGAARVELNAGSARRALGGVFVRDVMRPVGEAPGWLSVRSFVDSYAAARPGWVWMLREWNGNFGGVLLGDSLARVPYHEWDVARPLDVALPMSAAVPAAPGEEVLEALIRAEGHPVILVTTETQTLGAVLASDLEALVRRGGRSRSPSGAWARPN